MENKSNATPVAEAGILAALTIVIILFIWFMPLIGMAGFLVLPVPIAVLYIKHDFKLAFLAFVVTMIISISIIGVINGISITVPNGLVALALGYCFRKSLKESKALILLAVFSLMGFVFTIFVKIIFIDRNVLFNTINSLVAAFKQSFDVYVKMSGGANNDQVNMLKDMMNSLTPQFLLTMLPGAVAAYSFISAFVNYIIARAILKRLRFNVRELISFDMVYIDNRIGALLIILTCAGIILKQKNMLIGDYIYNSSEVLMRYTFLVIGAALVYFYLKNKMKLKKSSAVLITIVVALLSAGSLMFYLGLSDMIFDFRKVDPNRLFKGRQKQ